MIHQVARLPKAKRLLSDIVALQIACLEVAASVSVVDEDNLEKHLNRTSRFRHASRNIANWIVRKDVALLTPLNKFAAASTALKSAFVVQIRQDVTLLYRPSAQSFNIAILSGALPWQLGAKDFLYAFYDIWGKAEFDKYLFRPNSQGLIDGQKYGRQQFIREFIEVNPSLYMCAICDSTAYRTSTDTHAYTSIDHFFPRSIYPHLSCHPSNLIPICSICNSFIKNDVDPLRPNLGNITLKELILPYQDGSASLCKLAYIAVETRVPKAPTGTKHPLQIKIKEVKGGSASRQIATFDQLYKIRDRWDDQLEQIEEQAFRRLFQFFELDLATGNSLDSIAVVEEKVDLLMALTERDNIGKDPFGFPLVWMFNSYIEQLKMQKENATVYTELKDWANTHSARWAELRKLAKVIHERVPTAP